MKKFSLFLVALILNVSAFASGHTVGTTQTNVTCNGSCDGTATASVTGGVGPFTFAWNDGMAQTTATATALCVGSYTVTVTDNSDMSTATATVAILQPTAVAVTIPPPGPVCAGMCVPLNSIASGGTPPYSYMWTPSMNLSSATAANPLFCPVVTQTFTLTVTDANGCTATTTTTVFADPIFATVTTTNTTVCGGADGTATATPIGGYAPYTYLWTPSGGTGPTDMGLAAGTYSVSVTDAMGCQTGASGTVLNGGGGVSVVLDTLININCSGSSVGTVAVHGAGGTPPYSYAWSNGTTTPTMTGVPAGTYTVTVTGAGGCFTNATYTINNYANLFASITSNIANCASTGSATVSATGAHPPYTYQWNDPLNQTTATATNLSGGVYNVLITDSVGCTLLGNVSIDTGCYNTIRGRIYADTNGNCVQDGLDAGIMGRIVVANPGGYYGTTNANGDYEILTPNLNNIVSLSTTIVDSVICPAGNSIVANFGAMGDTLLNNNFSLYPTPGTLDLGIHPGWSSGNPGFPKTYWFLYWNNSSGPQNALVRFVYDSVLQYTGCTAGGVHYPAQHKIEWSFPSLAPGMYWDWTSRPQAFFNVPATVSITSNLHTHFEILPIAGDINPSDNVLDITEPVTGCHDPNSKSVIPQGIGPNGDIFQSDSVLLYTIHFQNNGNDTAYTVVVKDTLSTFLDPASVEPGASDHPYTFTVTGQGILTFRFDHIMLPDSIADEPGSNGYFNFKVKIKPGTPIGTVINNTASIYFDFNDAVVTNTTINTIVDVTTDIATTSTNNAVMVYPNPFNESTTFKIQSDNLNESYSFEMTDVLGKQVKSMHNISEKQFTVSRNGLQNGIYFYKIFTADGIVGIGKVIIK